MLIDIPDDFRLIDLIKIAASKGLSLKSCRINGETAMKMVKETSDDSDPSVSRARPALPAVSDRAVLDVQSAPASNLHLHEKRPAHACTVVALSDAARLRALGVAAQRTSPKV